MTPQEHLEQHVDRLNEGVRTGHFEGYSELFSDNGTLKLLGAGRSPATAARGRGEIARTCAEAFDGRQVRVAAVIAVTDASATFDYSLASAPKEVAGQMIVKWQGDELTCVTVTM